MLVNIRMFVVKFFFIARAVKFQVCAIYKTPEQNEIFQKLSRKTFYIYMASFWNARSHDFIVTLFDFYG